MWGVNNPSREKTRLDRVVNGEVLVCRPGDKFYRLFVASKEQCLTLATYLRQARQAGKQV